MVKLVHVNFSAWLMVCKDSYWTIGILYVLHTLKLSCHYLVNCEVWIIKLTSLTFQTFVCQTDKLVNFIGC